MRQSARPETTMFTLSQSARLTKSQDGGILLDVDHGAFFSLNRVGTRIVELLERGCDQPAIERTIASEFHVAGEVVKRDVEDFLASLHQQQLLCPVETAGDPEAREI